jgi:hypothetical protein
MGNFQASDWEFDPELSVEGAKKTSSTIDAAAKLESVSSTLDQFMERIDPRMGRTSGPALAKFDVAEFAGLRPGIDVDIAAPVLQKEQPRTQPEPEASHFEPLVKMASEFRSHPTFSSMKKDEALWSKLVMDSLNFVEEALAE